MKKGLSLGIAILLLGSPAVVIGARPVTNPSVSDFAACKGKTTIFTPEAAVEFRHRSANFDRRERAQQIYDDPSLERACSSSSPQTVNEDTTQALVAADILSRTKEVVIKKVETNKSTLTGLVHCMSGESLQTAGGCSYFKTTSQQASQMRLKLAISTLNGKCLGVHKSASDDEIRQNVAKCVSEIKLSHNGPMVWGGSDSVAGELEPLSPSESALIVEFFTEGIRGFIQSPKAAGASHLTDSRQFLDWVNSTRNAAENSYYAHLAENPILRFLPSPYSKKEQWVQAIQKTTESLDAAAKELKKKPVKDFSGFKWAIEEALSDAPTAFTGDYCEVAGHLIDEDKNLVRGKDIFKRGAMLGLGMISGGVGGPLLGSGMGALLAGGDWILGSQQYINKMQECQATGECTAEELEAAQSLAELDYLALGSFGAGLGTRALRRLSARNPAMANGLSGMNDQARRSLVDEGSVITDSRRTATIQSGQPRGVDFRNLTPDELPDGATIRIRSTREIDGQIFESTTTPRVFRRSGGGTSDELGPQGLRASSNDIIEIEQTRVPVFNNPGLQRYDIEARVVLGAQVSVTYQKKTVDAFGKETLTETVTSLDYVGQDSTGAQFFDGSGIITIDWNNLQKFDVKPGWVRARRIVED